MTDPQDQPRDRYRSLAKPTTLVGLVLAIAVAFYAAGQSILNAWTGSNFTVLTQNQSSPPGVVRPQSSELSEAKPTTQVVHERGSAPSKATDNPPPMKVAPPVANLRYGLLTDLGGERYRSPAGLMYTRGGSEGHRLDHLERHTQDDPSRPGKHGVFDGGMEEALKVIDRAYELAKTGQKTTKTLDQGRTIYTVDMGSPVGYIGGRDGNRLKKPPAHRVRLVLDRDRVVTAFPL